MSLAGAFIGRILAGEFPVVAQHAVQELLLLLADHFLCGQRVAGDFRDHRILHFTGPVARLLCVRTLFDGDGQLRRFAPLRLAFRFDCFNCNSFILFGDLTLLVRPDQPERCPDHSRRQHEEH